jgi:Peptidase family M28
MLKPKKREGLLFIASLVLALLSISAVSVDRLKAHVTWLADPAREGRHAGTPGAAAAAEYISQQLKELGCDVQMQDFGGRRKNVVGRIGRAERYVLLGAHYDGQGPGMPSASDNAAGVAVMLELIRELKGQELPVSMVAVAFDDEEQGLNGSRYYVDHPLYPLDQAQAAIIFDSMGRQFMDLSSWTLFVMGAEYSKELSSVVQKRARPEMLVIGTDLIGPRSDFAGFGLKRVPYLFFTHATHKDYHGGGDTADRVNYTRLAQDSELIAQIIQDIARLQSPPKFLDAPVYPPAEIAGLEHELDLIEKERKDLPQAYRLMFSDFRARLKADDTRELRRLATSALLALATPRLSGFMVSFFLGPYYERENRRDIAAAVYEEALKWETEPSERRALEEKIQALRIPTAK